MHFGLKAPGVLRILCLGDVVGEAGRRALALELAALRASLGLDMVIVNGENAAGGIGLTPSTLSDLLAAGADIVTTGNHIWRHKEIYPHLDKNPRLLRPANYPPGAPGKGHTIHVPASGEPVLVLNLLGRVYMDPVDCPFLAARDFLDGLGPEDPVVRIVDFHAEATSEKRAMAHFLDGKVSAVLGTHTHVQTADTLVSPLGTASLTDLGMCGAEEDSVLGFAKGPVLERFLTARPFPFRPSRGRPALNGAVLEIERSTGKALSIVLLRRNSPE